MKIATFANARTALEARKGIAPAFMCGERGAGGLAREVTAGVAGVEGCCGELGWVGWAGLAQPQGRARCSAVAPAGGGVRPRLPGASDAPTLTLTRRSLCPAPPPPPTPSLSLRRRDGLHAGGPGPAEPLHRHRGLQAGGFRGADEAEGVLGWQGCQAAGGPRPLEGRA
jgi:hypothetical protein